MRALFMALLAAAAACTTAGQPGETPDNASKTGSVASGSQDSDWKAIEALEAQAKQVARVDGCAASSACRAAPTGSRACGGPRYYIPYCSVTTDSAALFAKLAEVAKAEQAYNQKYQLASTCEMRLPPVVESVGGSCAAK